MLKQSIFNSIDGGNVKLFGVCELIKTGDSKAVKMPAELNDGGDVVYAGIDDNFTIVSYHRITDLKFSVEEKTSYGDGLQALRQIADGTLFCYVKPERANILAHDLASKISEVISINFPKEKLIEIGAISIVVAPVSASLDTAALLKQEYNIEDIELHSDAYLFAFKYQINIKYNACQNACK